MLIGHAKLYAEIHVYAEMSKEREMDAIDIHIYFKQDVVK
jgi:hypothetical protein